MLRIRLLFGVALAVLTSLASVSPSLAATTRAQYVAAADPECADATRDIGRINKRYSELHIQGDYKAAARLLHKTGVRLSRSIAAVARIAPPAGDEVLVASWLDMIRQVARNNRRMATPEAHGKFKARGRIQKQNDRIRRRAHELVADFGFQHCA